MWQKLDELDRLYLGGESSWWFSDWQTRIIELIKCLFYIKCVLRYSSFKYKIKKVLLDALQLICVNKFLFLEWKDNLLKFDIAVF